MKPFFKPKLYLSARISPDAHAYNNKVAETITDEFDVFKPHEHQVTSGAHEDIGVEVYRLDITAMENSDLALLLPKYGRDCAWEMGWYKGAGKPVYVYVEDQTEWLRDLMVKGGVAAVFTSNEATWERLRQDRVIGGKTYWVQRPDLLGEHILHHYDGLKNGRIVMSV
jgi:nucleoside 2-deoxyribosyltransferase